MKFLLLSSVVVVALSEPIEISEADLAQWELFKITYEKDYTTEQEEKERKLIFVNNVRFVREHNAKFDKGEVTFNVEINKFADLTTEELAAIMNGYKRPERQQINGEIFDDSEDIALTVSVDWRKKRAVTPVKNQGRCGSCWAFSATGSLEGQMFLRKTKNVSLSEQNLVDCSYDEGNYGCSGGSMNKAFEYIRKNNGIDTEASYPYEAKDNYCRYKAESKGGTVDWIAYVTSGSEISLMRSVAGMGPVSVGIDASHSSFQFYNSGVYKEPNCSTTELDHAVLAVGYDTAYKGGDYWLVKNSWGTDWGMKGYIMMARNLNNMCGIATNSSLPRTMMKIILLLVLVAVSLSQPIEVSDTDLAQWELFKITHEKEYATEEEEQDRKLIFVDNLKFVREHNAKFDKGEVTFDVAINQFSDLTTQEFAAMVNGFKQPKGFVRSGEVVDDSEDIALPKSVDWRKKGAVTGVKDQGQCGSCWAFSSTGSLEGQTFLKTKKLVSLSEQNLVDCSVSEGNAGCSGGYMIWAFTYIQKNKGIDTEASYPYEAQNDTCRYKPKNKGAIDSGYVNITSGSEKALQKAVAKVGPIAVAIDASHRSFQMYNSGVYKEPDCSTKYLDHAVLAVGYGTAKKGGAYWLVKNSWATTWGMKGYIMMARNHHNMCGIATMASYPTV